MTEFNKAQIMIEVTDFTSAVRYPKVKGKFAPLPSLSLHTS